MSGNTSLTDQRPWDFKRYIGSWSEEKFVENLPDETYHAIEAVSSGQLVTILDEEDGGLDKLYEEKMKGGKKVSDAMKFGTMFHKACLEGPDFLKRYKVIPEFVGMTKDGRPSTQSAEAKVKKQNWIFDQPPGTIFIEDTTELDQITGMLDSIAKHPIAKILLDGGRRELSGFFNWNGLRCRVRIDIYQDHLLMLTDLKTTRNALKKPFQKQIVNDLYYVQAAFYLMAAHRITGKPMNAFNFLAVEKTAPYRVSVHEVGQSFLSIAEQRLDMAAAKLKAAIETGQWHAQPQIAFTAEAPDWLINAAAAEAQ
jgi:hypothetical protein